MTVTGRGVGRPSRTRPCGFTCHRAPVRPPSPSRRKPRPGAGAQPDAPAPAPRPMGSEPLLSSGPKGRSRWSAGHAAPRTTPTRRGPPVLIHRPNFRSLYHSSTVVLTNYLYVMAHRSAWAVGWQTALGKLYCGARNEMTWDGGLPLPAPASPGCWLLPATDVAALAISREQAMLAMGATVILTRPCYYFTRDYPYSYKTKASRIGLAFEPI